MTESGRQLAATLGRIYPYRAAKQQAPGVAATDAKGTVATDAKGFPNWSGMTGRFPVEPGMTEGRILLQGGGEGVFQVDVGVGEEVFDLVAEGD